MTTAYSSLLGLALPVQGELSGQWGDMVNYGITDYVDISVAGTLSLTTDADVDLVITNGTISGTNIGSTTAQYAILNCSGTRTATRYINTPKQSKTYIVVNNTSQSVIIRGGPSSPTTGVTVATNTRAVVVWDTSLGTPDFVAVATSAGGSGTVTAVTGTAPVVSSGGTTPAISMAAANGSTNGYLTSSDWTTFNNKQPAGSYLTNGGALGTPSSGTASNLTGLPLSTGVTGILPIANGGTNAATAATARANILPTYAGNAGKVLAVNSGATDVEYISAGGTGTVTSVALSAPAMFTVTGSPVTTTGTLALTYSGTALPVANGGTGTSTPALVAGTNVTITGTWPNQTINATGGGGMTYPGAGIPNSTGSAWGTSYSTTGSGNVVLSTSPTLTTPTLGTPASVTLTNASGLPLSTGVTGTLPVANGGTGTATPSLVAGSNVTITGTWPNQTVTAAGSSGVTSVSGTSPIASSGGTTPTISIAQATSSTSGFLTSTDWNTFNNKQPAGSYYSPGGALGTPASGNFTSGSFSWPTFNQNTSGNAATATSATTATTATTANALNTSNTYTMAGLTVNGAITASSNITAYYSDDRLKTRIGKIENALAKVATLDAFYYHANEVAQALGYEVVQEVGISAQQVQAVMPETVAPAPIDPQYLTVRYERLVPLLIAAINELQAEVKVLKGV